MPDLIWHQPYSGAVAEIAHDPSSNEMLVRWKDGKISVYSDVSEGEFEQVRRAPSVGSAIHSFIKPGRQHRYHVEEEP